MSSLSGRLLRILTGIALIIMGLAVIHGTGGVILAVVGLVPLAEGIINVCVFAPLFGRPFFAKNIK